MKLQPSAGDDKEFLLLDERCSGSPRRGNGTCFVLAGLLTSLVLFNAFLLIKVSTLEQKVQNVEIELSHSKMEQDNGNDNQEPLFIQDEFENQEIKDREKRSPKNKPLCHLVGLGSEPPPAANTGTYFFWSNQSPLSSCTMNTKPRRSNFAKEIIINKRGFYHVYAQVTFKTRGMKNHGIQVVRTDIQSGRETAIMTSIVKQVNSSPVVPASDSTSVGGIFYMEEGDLLKVKDVTTNVLMSSYDARPDYSYFGVTFIRKPV